MSAPTTRRELRARLTPSTLSGTGEEGEEARTGGLRVSSATPDRTARARSAGWVAGEVLLWAAALAGLVCIVLVVLAFTANITLMMFRTGSMAPDIPAGSVAVVQRISAVEVAVGDVVTVDRPGELPVTHRVRSIEPGSRPGERVLVLRGDANAQDDPFPYTVSSVRVVRFAMPGAAPAIALMGNPLVLGGITVAAAVLVGWAFWPHRGKDSSPADGADAGQDLDAGQGTDTGQGTSAIRSGGTARGAGLARGSRETGP